MLSSISFDRFRYTIECVKSGDILIICSTRWIATAWCSIAKAFDYKVTAAGYSGSSRSRYCVCSCGWFKWNVENYSVELSPIKELTAVGQYYTQIVWLFRKLPGAKDTSPTQRVRINNYSDNSEPVTNFIIYSVLPKLYETFLWVIRNITLWWKVCINMHDKCIN